MKEIPVVARLFYINNEGCIDLYCYDIVDPSSLQYVDGHLVIDRGNSRVEPVVGHSFLCAETKEKLARLFVELASYIEEEGFSPLSPAFFPEHRV